MFIGEISALLTAVFWTFVSYVFTFAAKRIGTMMLNILRMFFASVLIIITMAIFTGIVIPTGYQILYLSISGFLGLVIGDTALFKTYTELGPRVSSLLMATNPAMAAFMAYFAFNEILSYSDILGMVVTLSGLFVVILDKRNGDDKRYKISRKGILFGFLAAFGQASGLIFAKMALQEAEINFFMATFVRIFSSVLMLIPIMLVMKKMKNPVKLLLNDKKAFYLVLLGSVLGPYFGISLSFVAINYAHIGVASTLMSIVPIIILPVAHFVFKEKISKQAIVGAFLAVIGVAMLFLEPLEYLNK